MASMRFDVVTLFPEMIQQASDFGIVGRAIDNQLVDLVTWNPRDFTEDRHRTVDARPYGGGPGMVMMYQPLQDAIINAKKAGDSKARKVVYLSPQGRPLTQDLLVKTCELTQLVLVAGRYEGIDERLIEAEIDEEWSLGDYVISGGELAALVVIDAVTRLVPGALGAKESAQQDSYMNGLLDCPHYTRPEVIDGKSVPGVLLSGNHVEIARWRLQQSWKNTRSKRPDLLNEMTLSDEQAALLKEIKTKS
ncbi:MAG: tRNA (guanosine(37)-N1)-methyltransferase TrmD [Methylococcales bacterium]|nr:tRNA (guanosine(37)-N1)-methyltransferase TrmD [Methylococcales bacterium]